MERVWMNKMGKNSKKGNEPCVIRFPMGILGFEDVGEYTVRRHGEGPVFELRAAGRDYPGFILFEAESIEKGYRPALPDELLKALEAPDEGELCFFVIAVVPKDVGETTVNLKSPLAVNFRAGLAAQTVLDGTDYSLRHRIFSKNGGR